jgi:hypothetical protein
MNSKRRLTDAELDAEIEKTKNLIGRMESGISGVIIKNYKHAKKHLARLRFINRIRIRKAK